MTPKEAIEKIKLMQSNDTADIIGKLGNKYMGGRKYESVYDYAVKAIEKHYEDITKYQNMLQNAIDAKRVASINIDDKTLYDFVMGQISGMQEALFMMIEIDWENRINEKK